MLMIRDCFSTCWSSEDVGRLQEVFGDDAHGLVQLADPPAVNVVLLDPQSKDISHSESREQVKETGSSNNIAFLF